MIGNQISSIRVADHSPTVGFRDSTVIVAPKLIHKDVEMYIVFRFPCHEKSPVTPALSTSRILRYNKNQQTLIESFKLDELYGSRKLSGTGFSFPRRWTKRHNVRLKTVQLNYQYRARNIIHDKNQYIYKVQSCSIRLLLYLNFLINITE